MSRVCNICGKRPQVANIVSHANNRIKKWVFPNVQKMRFIIKNRPEKKVINGKVCTKCLKAGRVQKVV